MSFKKIINIEFIKLLKPANYILIGLMLLLHVSIIAIKFYLFNPDSFDPDSFNYFFNDLFVERWILALFIAIFIIMNIGMEYSDGTLRKNIIDGYTRSQFFTGKLLVLLIFVLLVFLFGKISILIAGLVIGHFREMLLFLTPSLLINPFIKLLSTAVFALFLIFLTRNITISIVFYFLWTTIETVALYTLGDFLDITNVQSYLPIASMDSVLTENQSIHTSTIIIATLYLFMMLYTSYYLLLKRDIK